MALSPDPTRNDSNAESFTSREPASWPIGGGEMGELIRTHDWARTPLGSLETWPQNLRTAVDICLGSPSPMAICWGKDLNHIYNDAARRMIKGKHPAALGRPFREVWSEAWPAVSHLVERVIATGEPVLVEDMAIKVLRDSTEEDLSITFSYTALRGPDGTISGLLASGFETTEKVRTKARLAESEERFRSLIESWAQAVWETDAKGIVVTDSPSWRAYTGQRLEEWLGEGWADAVHPDDRANVKQQWQEAVHDCCNFNAEFRLWHAASGTWRWTLVRAVPLLTSSGTVRKWVGMNIDISRRKQALKALHESEAQYRLLFDSIDEGFCLAEVLFDEDGRPVDYRFLEVNSSFERQTGLQSAAGRTMRELAPEHEEYWFEIYGQVALTGEAARFERYAGSLGGRWYDVHAFRIGEPDQHRIAILFDDITARKSAEEMLRTSEERFRQFGNASSDVLWIRDAETMQWEYLSPAFESIFGESLTLGLGRNNLERWVDMILPQDRAVALDNIRRGRGGERVVFEYRIRRPSDQQVRWVRSTGFPLLDEAGNVQRIGGIYQDVTDAKETAERMRVLVAELQHRTRNLIAVVRSLADKTLARSSSLEDFRARFRDRLDVLARVQGLLSRLTGGERVYFDDLLRAELSAHGVIDAQGHGPQVKFEGPGEVRLRSSTIQTLALALHELATNAVKYGAFATPAGRLLVRWRIETRENEQQFLHVDWEESGVIVPTGNDASRRRGYGRELIERALPYQLNAETRYELGPNGVRCRIAVPITGVRKDHRNA